jgi:excisionase family DNA binding protein
MAFLTVKQVAERLQVSAATVYQLCTERKLTHLRVGAGRGTIRVREEDLNAFLGGATVRPAGPAGPKPPPLRLKHLQV